MLSKKPLKKPQQNFNFLNLHFGLQWTFYFLHKLFYEIKIYYLLPATSQNYQFLEQNDSNNYQNLKSKTIVNFYKSFSLNHLTTMMTKIPSSVVISVAEVVAPLSSKSRTSVSSSTSSPGISEIKILNFLAIPFL